MSKVLIVNNNPYNYPTAGDEPGWGGSDGATGWAEDVTQVLSDLLGPNDILETSFTIANNQLTATDVVGLNFNIASVRSAIIDYSIFRISTTNPSGSTETGTIKIVYDNNVGWSSGQGAVVGDSGVVLSITPTGQFEYTSSDIGSLNYTGTIKFRAKSLQQ